MQLLVAQVSPSSYCFLSMTFRYAPQHSVMKDFSIFSSLMTHYVLLLTAYRYYLNFLYNYFSSNKHNATLN